LKTNANPIFFGDCRGLEFRNEIPKISVFFNRVFAFDRGYWHVGFGTKFFPLTIFFTPTKNGQNSLFLDKSARVPHFFKCIYVPFYGNIPSFGHFLLSDVFKCVPHFKIVTDYRFQKGVSVCWLEFSEQNTWYVSMMFF